MIRGDASPAWPILSGGVGADWRQPGLRVGAPLFGVGSGAFEPHAFSWRGGVGVDLPKEFHSFSFPQVLRSIGIDYAAFRKFIFSADNMKRIAVRRTYQERAAFSFKFVNIFFRLSVAYRGIQYAIHFTDNKPGFRRGQSYLFQIFRMLAPEILKQSRRVFDFALRRANRIIF